MIEKLREELIKDILTYIEEKECRSDIDENTITQIIVDSFDEYEWSMNTNGNCELRNKVEDSMVQEAKFELINYKLRGTLTEYLVRLHDADGEVVNYHITDYYNEDLNEITSTRIWELSNRIFDVENDSRLGIKILGFITNEHFYRNDVLESMYVKEKYDEQ